MMGFIDACAEQQEAIDAQNNDITSRAYREFNSNKQKEKAMNKEFEVHILNEEGLTAAQGIAIAFDTFLNNLMALGVKDNREAAIVRTKLEEACFFAKKSIATIPSNWKT